MCSCSSSSKPSHELDPSLAMALVLGFLTWPLNFFLEGEFNMSVWAFGFDALAAAAVMVYDFTRYDAMQVRRKG